MWFYKNSEKTTTGDALIAVLRSTPSLIDFKDFRKFTHSESILPTILNLKRIPRDVKKYLYKQIISIATVKYPNCIFFASAACNVDAVKSILKNTNDPNILHKTKEGSTPLSFLLRFGDYKHENFLQCMELLITQNNINQVDYYNKTPLKVASDNHASEEIIRMLLLKGADRSKCKLYREERYNDVVDVQVPEKPPEILLFEYAIQERPTKFKELLTQFQHLKDYDDGENTLLQYCIIFDKPKIAKILLEQNFKVNVNFTTARNNKHPLLLAAILNRWVIFNSVLERKDLEIDSNMFSSFVKFRGNAIKIKFFKNLLEYKRLNVDLRTGDNNTPLHFAIRFHNKRAIQSLLKRGASLTYKNNLGQSCLNIINPQDLEEYFDSCVIFDNYTDDIQNPDYKLQFDFRILVKNKRAVRGFKDHIETDIVRKLGARKRLQYLLNHVLIQMLVTLKWRMVNKFFYICVGIRVLHFIYATFILLLYPYTHWLILSFIIQIGLNFQFLYRHRRDYNVHSVLETFNTILYVLYFTIDKSKFNIVSSIAYITMSLSFLLLLGYHPSFSKWSAMLQKIYKTFFLLFCFFIWPIISFSLGFYQLFSHSESFKNIDLSIFTVLAMLTGELNAKDNLLNMEDSIIKQLLFILFAICMTVILMNFLLAVTISDIGKIERNSEVIAINNTIKFIQYSERAFLKIPRRLLFLKHFVNSPFIFHNKNTFVSKEDLLLEEEDQLINKKGKYKMNCYINNLYSFEEFDGLKLNLDIRCKIQNLYDMVTNRKKTQQQEKEREEKIDDITKRLSQVEDISKKMYILEEMVKKINSLDELLKKV